LSDPRDGEWLKLYEFQIKNSDGRNYEKGYRVRLKKGIVSGFAAMGMAAAIIVPLSYGAQGRLARPRSPGRAWQGSGEAVEISNWRMP
jgi:hypothetical protein